MKKNGKILIVMLIVILALGLCACNRVNGPQDDDNGDDNGNDNIVFTITFDTNGGSAVASVTVKKGTALRLPADPIKYGFVFDGWYLDEALVRQFVDTQTISADITLYAKWVPEETKYTVTFVGGDDATGEAPESLQKVEDAEFTLPSNTFEKAGFDFVGWSDGRKTYAVGDSYTMPAHAVKFVAQWQRTYSVTYIIDDETFKTETLKEGEEIVLPTAPSKIGHEFAGWFSDEDLTEEFAAGQLVDENTTVYGHYIVLPKYKVNFIVYGKIYSSVESWGYEAVPTPKDVSRDSLALDGWYLDETYQTPYTDNYFETKALTADVYVYSKWTPVDNGYAMSSSAYFDIDSQVLTMKHEKYLSSDTESFDLRNKFTVSTGASWRAFTSPECLQPTEITSRIASISEYGWTEVYVMVENLTTYENKVYTLRIYKCPAVEYNTLEDGSLEIVSVADCDDVRFLDDELVKISSIAENAFANCTSMEMIQTMPNLKTIGDSAFKGCFKLTSIMLGAEVVSIGNDVFNYTALESIVVSEDSETYISKDGILYNKADKSIFIVPSKIKGDITLLDGLTSIEEGAFSGRSGLISVTIPDSVESIATAAFDGCTKLESITVSEDNETYISKDGILYNKADKSIFIVPSKIKGDVTLLDGLTSIAEGAFSGRSGLISVTIPDSVESIATAAFDGCTKLESITVSEDNETYISKDGILYNKADKSIFIVPSKIKGDVTLLDGLTSISSSDFVDRIGLTGITIPDSVTSIGAGAFKGCNTLESMTIPFTGESKAASNVYDQVFGYIFGYSIVSSSSGTVSDATLQCYSNSLYYWYHIPSSLKMVVMSESATSIYEKAFRNCTGLTSITIPDSVTSIGESAFSGCTGLTSITIPDKVTSIGDWAFYGCSSLESMTIPFVDSTYEFRRIFGYTSKSTTGTTWIDGWHYYIPSSLRTVVISDGATSICDQAFDGFSSLTSITIPNSVTSIGYEAFRNCTGLTSITIPDSVTSIDYGAFQGCAGLVSITIPDSVTSIGDYAFYGCTGLASVTIGSAVTSIGESAFCCCYKLIEVCNKSSLNITAGSEDNGYVAYYAKNVYTTEGGSKLSTDENGYIIYTDGNEKILVDYTGTETELTLPSDITQINQYAFYYCSRLTSITIPDSVTSIGTYAFYNCSGLTSITIPDSVTSIGNDAFYGCTGLASVTIGSAVTSIGWGAFRGCTRLRSISIPSRVKSIGTSAFSGCSYLNSITVEGMGSWYYTKEYDNCIKKTGGTWISLKEPSTNATYFTSTYCEYYWYRD